MHTCTLTLTLTLLYTLVQNESRIQLPADTDEDLVDPAHFSVFSDSNLSNQLDLSVKLADQAYLVQCEASEDTPELVLVSKIFRNADQVDRNRRADTAVRRVTVGSR